jgi:hypothetical protein
MIRRLATVTLVLLAVSGLGTGAFAQDPVQRSFGGDTVRLNLSTGNYRVTSSSDDKIRVIPRTDPDKVSVRLSTNVMGTGELTAAAFDAKAHGVRTFEWSGNGSHNLNVRVNSGKVTLKN